jgi:hypothetical protein
MVIDDVLSVSPWRARGLEVRGEAEIEYSEGKPYVKVTPLHKKSWGL